VIAPENSHSVSWKMFFFMVKDTFLCAGAAPDADVNYYTQCSENIENSLSEFYTLVTDLNRSEKEIWEDIYHRTQAEILSFTGNTVFEHSIIKPDKEQLEHFISMFNEFARRKKIRKAEKHRLQAYNKNGLLAISFIRQQEKYICIHFYRVTTERAVNLHAFNMKHQLGDEFTGSHIGRAHRALHWLDMLEFKKAGVKYYDFCGWYAGKDDKDLLNINAFKEQFSRNKIKEYSGVIYRSPVLKMLKKISSWIRT
jgi:hypothetical protein